MVVEYPRRFLQIEDDIYLIWVLCCAQLTTEKNGEDKMSKKKSLIVCGTILTQRR